ncbi:hydroxymethylglutaryl-CoA reductase, degradative [bacterium]|nr:MAG: hydroxymethylglutaryl-CoA reductase, degradative [bacterium]
MNLSRLPGFYKLPVPERLNLMRERGILSHEEFETLSCGAHVLTVARADKIIENVIGVMALPLGLGLNFLVNGKDYVVPLVVEEPSIVAALSSAAKLIRAADGFTTRSTESILIGQVQIVDVDNATAARDALLQRKRELLDLANSLHPRMVARGGGARDVEVHLYPAADGRPTMVVLHLLVDTCDAMGANMVNTMCEGVAPLVERITGGKVLLRILSNLTDRALVWANVVIPAKLLAGKRKDGEQVRDGIILANALAEVDPYRAATHNKGIMNGVDAVALATGNDWRALEAAAHAYAARGEHYTSLTRWYKNDQGSLVGEIEIPIKVGTVGGNLQSNATVAMNHHLLKVSSARELAEIMGAVGLAQNFAALHALATDGIQQGHMTLHARGVAVSAGATPEIFETVVERLLDCGEIKVWKAKEIIAELKGHATSKVKRLQTDAYGHAAVETDGYSIGYGKVILLGEHAVVYGRHAIAAPVAMAVRARAEDSKDGTQLIIPSWGVEQRLRSGTRHPGSLLQSLELILQRLDLAGRPLRVQVHPSVPRANGLGCSAALAVAVIRALNQHCALNLTDQQVCALAYECERVAHGTPSGIDNTVATYGRPLLYRRGEPPLIEPLHLAGPLPLVIGLSGIESLTARTVGRVREAWQQHTRRYERIFDDIDALALQGVKALEAWDLHKLGQSMNTCQRRLRALGVSSCELEVMIEVACANGALGAKLTGGGGGGAMIALCPDDPGKVVRALQEAGFQALEASVG